MIPVRDLNVMTIASACGQPRDLVNTALKVTWHFSVGSAAFLTWYTCQIVFPPMQDIFLYAGEVALSGAPLRLDFHGIGSFQCSAGPRFRFNFPSCASVRFFLFSFTQERASSPFPRPSILPSRRICGRAGTRPAASRPLLAKRRREERH